jgi:hypothetical protein
MTPLIFALALMTAAPPAADDAPGEPLPPGAPTEPYELSAWCYGALGEYLAIYDKVKPDLRDIDHMFGTSGVVEDEPYQSDMAAYRVELKVIGDSVSDAEKASPEAITDRGVSAMRRGREIWSLAETKTNRELARAWLSWDLPDRCDSNARELATRSIILGKALKYNANDRTALPAPTAEQAAPMSGGGAPAIASAAFATPVASGPPAQAAPTSPPPSPETQATAPEPTSPSLEPSSEPPAAVMASQPPPASSEAAPTGEVNAGSPQVMDTAPQQAAAEPPAETAPAPALPTPPPASASAATPSTPSSEQSQEPTL